VIDIDILYNCKFCMHRKVCKHKEFFTLTKEENCKHFLIYTATWRKELEIMAKTIYLGGEINGCTDSECNDWRESAKEELEKKGFFIRNPMDRDYRGRETECVDEIVEMDKVDIDFSDTLLIYYVKPSVGTSMEVFYAWDNDKEIIIVYDSDKPVSPWLKYHSSHIFKSFHEAIKHIMG